MKRSKKPKDFSLGQLTELAVETYPDEDVKWSEYDEKMLEYYYAIFGKNVKIIPEHFSIAFDKSGYTTEVNLGDWVVTKIINTKTGEQL